MNHGIIPQALHDVLARAGAGTLDLVERYREMAKAEMEDLRRVDPEGVQRVADVPSPPESLEDAHFLLVLVAMARRAVVTLDVNYLRETLQGYTVPFQGTGYLAAVGDMGAVLGYLSTQAPGVDFETQREPAQRAVVEFLVKRLPAAFLQTKVRLVMQQNPDRRDLLAFYRGVLGRCSQDLELFVNVPSSNAGTAKHGGRQPWKRGGNGGNAGQAARVNYVGQPDGGPEGEIPGVNSVQLPKGQGNPQGKSKAGGKPTQKQNGAGKREEKNPKGEFQGVCFKCGVAGHKRQDCPKREPGPGDKIPAVNAVLTAGGNDEPAREEYLELEFEETKASGARDLGAYEEVDPEEEEEDYEVLFRVRGAPESAAVTGKALLDSGCKPLLSLSRDLYEKLQPAPRELTGEEREARELVPWIKLADSSVVPVTFVWVYVDIDPGGDGPVQKAKVPATVGTVRRGDGGATFIGGRLRERVFKAGAWDNRLRGQRKVASTASVKVS